MLINILNAFFALVIIAAAIGLLAQGARWLGLSQAAPQPMRRQGRRLAILDAAPLDARRRLLLVRINSEERALVVGGDNDFELSPLEGRRRIAAARAFADVEDEYNEDDGKVVALSDARSVA
ncbi:MAG: flagellar biosynthetic protein FliO [Pseudomonadota bacterium]